MKTSQRLFILDNKLVIPLTSEAYNDLMNNKVPLKEYSGKKVKIADVHLEKDDFTLKAVVGAEFRVLPLNKDGFVDLEEFKVLFKEGIEEPELEYEKKFTWKPDDNEFRTIISLAIKKDFRKKNLKVFQDGSLYFDDSNQTIKAIRKLINRFPGIKVVGNNLTINEWNISFDIVDKAGIISYIFLNQGLEHESAKELKLFIKSPDNNMRFILGGPQHYDQKKAGFWATFIYDRRMNYKDQPKQEQCNLTPK